MMIGRWEPVVEKSQAEMTLRMGPEQKRYLMVEFRQPLLLNFSIEALKVIRLLSTDIAQKGALRVIANEERARGSQVSPYVVLNRTGLSLFLESDAIVAAKLRSGEKMHLQSKSPDLEEAFGCINYQIEGEPSTYLLDLNLIQSCRPVISFRDQKYRLVVWAAATPILKEIVISAPYVLHNATAHPLVLTVGAREYRLDPDAKAAIPFTEDMSEGKVMRLEFPHLRAVTENYPFQFKDIAKGYEHYIVCAEKRTFNCLVEVVGA